MLGRRQRLVVWSTFLFGFATVAVQHWRQPTGRTMAPWASRDWTLPTMPVELPQRADNSPLATEIGAAALRNRIDPALILAVIEVESGSDPSAVSPKGAIGLMQVMPETAALMGVSSPADPARNLEAGCRYLASLLASFGGDVELALAAYNAGPGAVRRWGSVPPYRETRDFVVRVSEAYRRITGLEVQFASRFVSDVSPLT